MASPSTSPSTPIKSVYTPPPRITDQTSVASKGYIPPHLRKNEKNTVPTDLKSLDKEFFPSLDDPKKNTATATAPTTTSNVWNKKTTFKTKIENLISFDKLTAKEKLERIQLKHAMEGFEKLSLKLTEEDRAMLYEQRQEQDAEINAWNNAAFIGIQGLISLEDSELLSETA
jgi:hypothetical protein